MFDIIVSDPHGHDQRYALEGEHCHIGRGADNNIVIDAPYISAHHCTISRYADCVTVIDAGSSNGTYVDGELATHAVELLPDSVIAAGEHELRVRSETWFEDVGTPAQSSEKPAWLVLTIVGSACVLALLALWLSSSTETPSIAPANDDPTALPEGFADTAPWTPPPVSEWITHTVIPAQTVKQIARRYSISVEDIARWNNLNPSDPQLETDQQLRIQPVTHPMPHQRIVYEVERGETLPEIATRFGADLDRIWASNPRLKSPVSRGDQIEIWVDLQPPKPKRTQSPILRYEPPAGGLSIGAPADGKLVDAQQLPDGGKLYVRRAPGTMWGSSHTVRHLAAALASFREDIDYSGTIVVGDLSKKNGGKFPPHASHQSGRDVDIWLPAIRGVYKKRHLGDGKRKLARRPEPEEADWFAVWGLVRALARTGEVEMIFLDERLHSKVLQAARIMSSDEHELASILGYSPNAGSGSPRPVLRHSAEHVHHIHVRFRCAKGNHACHGNR